MSIDTAMFMLKTPARDGRGFEYRVTISQDFDDSTDMSDPITREMYVCIFGKSLVFRDHQAALDEADDLLAMHAVAGTSPEYTRICEIELDEPFPESRDLGWSLP